MATLLAGSPEIPDGTFGKRGTSQIHFGRDDGLCSGRVETLAAIGRNGSGEVLIAAPLSPSFKFGDFHAKGGNVSAPTPVSINWDKRFFVAQTSTKDCWAAVLAMLANWFNLDHSRERFVEVLKEGCPQKRSGYATTNQIVFAFTKALTGQGEWIGDRDGAMRAQAAARPSFIESLAAVAITAKVGHSLQPALPMQHQPFLGTEFEAIPLTRSFANGTKVEGGIYPIYYTSELYNHIRNNNPVVAGLGKRGRGHVVLITSIIARPGGIKEADNAPLNLTPQWRTKIESIGYVDPAGTGEIEWMPGDQFIAEARFIFATRL